MRQIVDDVKSVNSERKLPIDAGLLEVFKAWKQTTQFSAPEDWIFESTVQVGRLPYSYTGMLHVFQKAAKRTGIGTIGTHTMRHTFRSWLTPRERRLQSSKGNADIRITMNTYGDVATDEIVQASGKVARLA